MFKPGQKVVRKDNEDKNKKWPDKYLDIPIRVLSVSEDGKRVWLDNVDLRNDLGWVSSRFISANDPSYDVLKRFF
jgi:hypothetical protein